MTIYRKSCLNQLIAGCLVFVGVAANLPTVFAILPAGYESGYYVILWLGLSKLIDMATGVNGVILSTSRYYAYDSVFFVLLIFVTILANKLLIPLYGMNGAAIGAVLATFLYNFGRTVLVGLKFGLQPFTWRNAAVLVLAGLIWFVAELVPHHTGSWWILGIDVALRSAAIGGLFLGGIYVFNLSPDATELLNGGWSRLKKILS